MSLPNLTWDLDPVFFELNLPLFPTLLVVAALGAVGALLARRKQDEGGQRFGWFILVVAAIAAFYFKGDTWTPGLRYYSLLFVVVFLGGYALLHWQIRRGGGGPDEAGDFIVYGVVAVLVGARLGHVLFYDLDKALAEPTWVLQIWTGGLASHGAVIGLIVAMYLFTTRRGVPFLEGSDRFSFAAALGATLVRLGNFFNSEIVGRATDQSWGVRFPQYVGDRSLAEAPLRHPSQLYEVALGLAVLGALVAADRMLGKEKRPRGFLISLFFAIYFTGRFGIEFVKEFQTLEPDSLLTMGQYLSLPGALLGYYGIWWSLQRRLPVGWKPRLRRAAREDRDEDDEDEDEAREADDDDDERSHDPDVDDEFGASRPARKSRRRRPRDTEEPVAPRARKKKRRQRPHAEDRAATDAPPRADAERKPRRKKSKGSQKPRTAVQDETPSNAEPTEPTASEPDAAKHDGDRDD